MRFHDWINNIRWKYFTNNKAGLIFKELTKEFRIVYKMTENKRFVMYEHKDNDYILDSPNTSLDFIEMLGDALSSEEIVDILNEQEEEIQRLKIQLQTDDVCNKCKHEYLVQQNDGYYISKCKKGFDECSKGTIKYCEDFELKGDVE